jgi:hypothetical protein
MLRPEASNEVVAGPGDVFDMKMYFQATGDYEMHSRVVAFEADRCMGQRLKLMTHPGESHGHPGATPAR